MNAGPLGCALCSVDSLRSGLMFPISQICTLAPESLERLRRQHKTVPPEELMSTTK